jgi:ectoine hydroxylase-related dioxygenase (phytanoyl-CoA dioxygenase family)
MLTKWFEGNVMTSTLLRPISEEEVARFEVDGAICLKTMFDTRWIEATRAMIENALGDPGPIVIDVREKTGRMAVETYPWRRIAAFRDYIFQSPAAAIAARLLRSENVNLLYDQFLVKEPGTETPTSWHQDGPSWPVHSDHALSIWMALDPVTLCSGGLKYVRGSHKGPRYSQYVNVVRHGQKQAKSGLPDCPDFDTLGDAVELLSWDLEPGDCVVHNLWTAHATGGNLDPATRRRAHTTRWTGDRATYSTKSVPLRMPFTPDLKDGAPLNSEWFPQVPFARTW